MRREKCGLASGRQMRLKAYQLLLTVSGRRRQQSFLKRLQEAEGASASEIRQLQDKLLHRLLRHAYFKVPYYRGAIDELGGLEFIAGTSPAIALNEMPLLTKSTMRQHWDDLKSRDLEHQKWLYNASGGSTGEPVTLIQDWEFFLSSNAVKTLFDSWTGYTLGMPKVCLWGSYRDLQMGGEEINTRIARRIRNECWLNSFKMTEEDMLGHVRRINKIKPIQILAYVEGIYELTRFIEKEGLKIHSPQAIMTSAGTLYPHMRKVIERVFRAPAFNRYGSREVGDIACECEAHRGLHVSPLTHYVEILREDGTHTAPGELGQVVVTSLVNYAMPLIRYRIGDMASWAGVTCSCGRAWPSLYEVAGRTLDTFTKRDGTKVVPEYFIHMIGVVLKPSWLRKFQVVQEDYERIRLLIEPAIDSGKALIELERDKTELEQKVRLIMGNNCQLEIELVDDIPPSPSGKYRYTISRIGNQQ